VFLLDVVFARLVGVHFDLPQQAASVVAAIVIPALVVYLVWFFPRARALVRHWAVRNGFEMLHCEHRFLFKGPYFWRDNRWQPVFRVRVRDRQGHERLGWVRCGGSFTGVFSDEASVIWDNERSA
jgi:hypothetical protein